MVGCISHHGMAGWIGWAGLGWIPSYSLLVFEFWMAPLIENAAYISHHGRNDDVVAFASVYAHN
jgi:hypothetical protein